MLTGLPPHRIAAAGVGRTFQNIRLCPQMSVLDNVLLAGRFPYGEKLFGGIIGGRSLSRESNSNHARAEEALNKVEMWHKRAAMGNELSHGQRRLVEIARALMLRPKVLLMDEPTSGLYPEMVTAAQEIVKTLCDDGLTILFTEHNMQVVTAISDKVVVLNRGRKIAAGTVDEVVNDPNVIEAYLGQKEDVDLKR
jgi:ABC-type branched-subunit amino acid transport system ATPase component